jgi:hypothetical protein
MAAPKFLVAPVGENFLLPFGRTGSMVIFTGPRIYFPFDVSYVDEVFSLTTAPTGSSAIFDVLKNGTTIFSTKAVVSASGFLAAAAVLSGAATWTARTDYLQVSCTQIGSTLPGQDLVAHIRLRGTS